MREERIKTIPSGIGGKTGCGECQTSCQSACKTSCGVANQSCENSHIDRGKVGV